MGVVVMPVYRRPEYLRAALRSWELAVRRSSSAWTLRVRMEPNQPAMRSVLNEFDSSLQLSIVENQQRLGVLTNPHRALADGFDLDDFVVYGEEDVVVADDVLLYAEWARDQFAKRKAVVVVGFTQRWWTPGDHEDEWTARTYGRFAPTGFATWVDRWDALLRPEWQFDYRRKGWDWHIQESLVERLGYRVVTPSYARSQHIGREGGAHMTARLFESHLCPTFRESFGEGTWREI